MLLKLHSGIECCMMQAARSVLQAIGVFLAMSLLFPLLVSLMLCIRVATCHPSHYDTYSEGYWSLLSSTVTVVVIALWYGSGCDVEDHVSPAAIVTLLIILVSVAITYMRMQATSTVPTIRTADTTGMARVSCRCSCRCHARMFVNSC